MRTSGVNGTADHYQYERWLKNKMKLAIDYNWLMSNNKNAGSKYKVVTSFIQSRTLFYILTEVSVL